MAGSNPKHLRAAAITYLAAGAAFLAVGFSGQRSFIGVGFAFFGIAIAWFAKARKMDGGK